VAWSPDGTRLATGSDDRTVRIWDAVTGEPQATLEGHNDRVNAVAWSPDGTRLATGSNDRTVRIWDAVTGETQATLEGHIGAVRSVAWSPDGTRLATASNDGTVRIWDAATGETAATFEAHSDWVNAVAWSPDGTRLATGSDDGTVRIWDAVTGEPQARLEGHSGGVRSLAWSPDGTRLATASNDRTVRIWDATGVDTGWRRSRLLRRVFRSRLRAKLHGHSGVVVSVVWSPDGTRLATGSWDYTVRIWDATDVDTGWRRNRLLRRMFRSRPRAKLRGHSGWVNAVAWSPDGTRVATASNDDTVRIWDAATGEPQATLEGHNDRVRSVAWSPDGTRLATASDDGMVRIWDPPNTTATCVVRVGLTAQDLDWNRVGVAVGYDQQLAAFNVALGELPRQS
jgi:WD40 repeat protein